MIDTSFGLKTWIYSGLFWGVCVFLIIDIIMPVMDDVLVSWDVLYHLPIWLIIGLVMQYFLSKWIYKKGRYEREKID